MKKQANSRTCFVCGVDNIHGLHIQFYEEQPGKITAAIKVPGHFQGYPGIVHGGIIAAMLDEVSGRTIMTDQGNRWMVTASLSIRYRKPVPVEKPLKLVGLLKEDSGIIARVHGEILDEMGVLLAEGDAVMASVPTSVQASMDRLSNEDWKVYPD
jgi:acyl-coenzyme A thioesterase PaaI-like protein